MSTDVEADGPIPGPHSMLSFASAAYTEDKQLIATFSANLELLEGASAASGAGSMVEDAARSLGSLPQGSAAARRRR